MAKTTKKPEAVDAINIENIVTQDGRNAQAMERAKEQFGWNTMLIIVTAMAVAKISEEEAIARLAECKDEILDVLYTKALEAITVKQKSALILK